MIGKSSCSSVAFNSTKRSKTMSTTRCGRAFSRSILLMTTTGLSLFSSAVRNNGDVADLIHERRSSEGEKRRIWWHGSRASNEHENSLQQWNSKRRQGRSNLNARLADRFFRRL